MRNNIIINFVTLYNKDYFVLYKSGDADIIYTNVDIGTDLMKPLKILLLTVPPWRNLQVWTLSSEEFIASQFTGYKALHFDMQYYNAAPILVSSEDIFIFINSNTHK